THADVHRAWGSNREDRPGHRPDPALRPERRRGRLRRHQRADGQHDDRRRAVLQRRPAGMRPDGAGAACSAAGRRHRLGGAWPAGAAAGPAAGRNPAVARVCGGHAGARLLERGRPALYPGPAFALCQGAPRLRPPAPGLGRTSRRSARMNLYEPAFRHVLYPAYERLRGRRTLQHLGEYEANQWRSPEEIAALQWAKLKALVEHCWREVPYYRTRWQSIGFEPGDLRSMRDYARLPV